VFYATFMIWASLLIRVFLGVLLCALVHSIVVEELA